MISIASVLHVANSKAILIDLIINFKIIRGERYIDTTGSTYSRMSMTLLLVVCFIKWQPSAVRLVKIKLMAWVAM